MARPDDVAFNGEKMANESAEDGFMHRWGMPRLGIWGQGCMHI